MTSKSSCIGVTAGIIAGVVIGGAIGIAVKKMMKPKSATVSYTHLTLPTTPYV